MNLTSRKIRTARLKVRQIEFARPDPDVVNELLVCLTDGGIVAAPTETRYGLLVRADRDEELRRLYEVKGRDLNSPSAMFVTDIYTASQLGDLNPIAQSLAGAFLPGPLTLVLKATNDWGPPRAVDGKIGIRISSAPVIREIMDKATFPVSATSANLSGEPDPIAIEDVQRAFGDQIQIYVDAGRIEYPVSTVVDCSSGKAKIVRQGAISQQMIEQITGRIEP